MLALLRFSVWTLLCHRRTVSVAGWVTYKPWPPPIKCQLDPIPIPSLHYPFALLHLSPHATLTNPKCLQTLPNVPCGQNCHQWRTINLALCRKSCQPLNSKISQGRMCASSLVFQTLCLEYNRGSSNQYFKGNWGIVRHFKAINNQYEFLDLKGTSVSIKLISDVVSFISFSILNINFQNYFIKTVYELKSMLIPCNIIWLPAIQKIWDHWIHMPYMCTPFIEWNLLCALPIKKKLLSSFCRWDHFNWGSKMWYGEKAISLQSIKKFIQGIYIISYSALMNKPIV